MTEVRSEALAGFGRAAQTYRRGRPDYPPEMLGWLSGDLDIGPGKTVIDLGAGTGKFTPWIGRTGARVIAIEPVEAMRAELIATLPDVRTLAGTAQAMPLDAATADAVVCAQAFHWFSTAAALTEIHRVLKPGGRLGLVWNVRDDTVDWVAAITAIMTPYEGDAPRYPTGNWRGAFHGDLFTALDEVCFAHQQIGAAQTVILDRFMSVSFIAALPDREQARVADRLKDLIASHPALRGQHSIVVPYRTHAFSCRRRP